VRWLAVTGLTITGVMILRDHIGPVIWRASATHGLHVGDLAGLGALVTAAGLTITRPTGRAALGGC
jgi:hypothetical protein